MKSYRWIWAVTLLFYVSGCTAYVPAFLPGDKLPDPPPTAESTPVASPDSEMVSIGMGLRLTLIGGETVHGTVVEITEDALAFGKPSNYGMDKDYYLFEAIEKIEVPKNTKLTSVLAITFLGLTVLVVGMAVTLGHSLSRLN